MTNLRPSRDTTLRIGLAVLVFAYFSFSLNGFASFGNMYSLMEACALTGIVTVAVGVTMLAGELDLSVGSVAACAGIIAVQLSGSGLFVAVAVPTIAGIIYGVIQGSVIFKLGISSLVVTLGTFIAMRGLAFVMSDEKTLTVEITNLSMSTTLKQQIGVFSPFSLTMVVIFVAAGVLLRLSRPGREIYAIGGARHESRTAGVPQARPLVLSFATSGGLAALAGSLASLRAGSADPAAYETLLLTAVTASLIGGISLYGGRGGVFGMFIGVVTLQLLLSGLSLGGAPFWAADLATGVVLVGFLIIDLANEASPTRRALRRFRAARRPTPTGVG